MESSNNNNNNDSTNEQAASILSNENENSQKTNDDGVKAKLKVTVSAASLTAVSKDDDSGKRSPSPLSFANQQQSPASNDEATQQQPGSRAAAEAAVGDFDAVLEAVGAFSRLPAQLDPFLTLSLLIPRLSPLLLSYTANTSMRCFDRVAYADGKKCDELRAQAVNLSYLNELYTRAFQANQVPGVLNELAQLLPVAQLANSSNNNDNNNNYKQQSAIPVSSDSAKLIHLYANMLMHCISRTDDPHVQRFIQALAVLHPDVREHIVQNTTSTGTGLPASVPNGDLVSEELGEEGKNSFSKLISPTLMNWLSSSNQQLKAPPHNPLGVCMSLPLAPSDGSSSVTSPQALMGSSDTTSSAVSVQASGTGIYYSQATSTTAPRLQQPQSLQHPQISRQRTMPEGASALASLANRTVTPGQPTTQGCVFVMEGSGMRDVPIWLKNLRLHKYTPLFEKMTYEEMMTLTEEWLEANKVTKGATNKILHNIQKLRERQSQLRHFESELMQNLNVDIRSIVDSVHQMMNTPIKRFLPSETTPPGGDSVANSNNSESTASNMQWILGDDNIQEGDLASQITRLVGRLMCCFLIKPMALSEPSLIVHFIKLVDKCSQHEAFTDRHRSILAATKQRCSQFVYPQSRSTWSPSGPPTGSPGSNSMGYRKPRPVQSELRASPSGPPSLPGSRNSNSNGGVIGNGVGGIMASNLIANNHNLLPSPPNRNYWLPGTEQQQQQQTITNNSIDATNNSSQQYPQQRTPTGSVTPLVCGRPPHSMVTPPTSGLPAAAPSPVDNYLAFTTTATTSQGPPGFPKSFKSSNLVGLAKTPLGRTQSAPQAQPPACIGGAGGGSSSNSSVNSSLLMMSFGNNHLGVGTQAGGLPQSWLSSSQRKLGSPLSMAQGSPTTAPGVYGGIGSGTHLALSPQTSNSGAAGLEVPELMNQQQRQVPSSDAEALADSQMNTLCLQMTDFLNTPDLLEGDDKFSEP